MACACGCGKAAKPGNRFVKGHNRAGRSFSAARRYALIAEHRQRWLDVGVAYGTCLCGCGEPTKVSAETEVAKDWIAGEPRLWAQDHDKLGSVKPYEVAEGGCWVWLRSYLPNGYGQYRGTTAHRHYYEDRFGHLPEGLDLHHTCQNRGCVNPDHLTPLTRPQHTRLHRDLAEAA